MGLLVNNITINNKKTRSGGDPPIKRKKLKVYTISWYGDYYKTNTHNFYLQFMEDVDGYNGDFISLDILSTDFNFSGIYSASNSKGPNTVYKDNSTKTFLQNGSIVGEKEACEECNLEIIYANNHIKCLFTFNGVNYSVDSDCQINNGLYPGEPLESSEFSLFTKNGSATLWKNYGEFQLQGYVNGDRNKTVSLLFNIPSTSDNTLPIGTYVVNENKGQYSLTPGEYYRGYLVGSIYTIQQSYATLNTYYFRSGSVQVTKENNNYHIEGTLISGCGSTVHITYDGLIPTTVK